MMIAEILPGVGDLAGYGAAGLMGALWMWERRLSRGREAQLTEAHARLIEERGVLAQMASLVRRNTAALSRLQATQEQLIRLLSHWRGDDESPAAPAQGAA